MRFYTYYVLIKANLLKKCSIIARETTLTSKPSKELTLEKCGYQYFNFKI